jgi:phospholipase C
VSSENFDHTSVLQFLEHFTGVRETNITDWRRKTFGDLTSVFNFSKANNRPPQLPDTSGMVTLAKYTSVNLPAPVFPGSDQKYPEQEKGSRKRVRGGKG